MKNKKQRNSLLLVILLLTVTIGYAVLTTNLKITGTANIKSNTWDVHFENIANQTGVTPTVAPVSNNTTTTELTFTVDLDLPGDYYQFNVDAVNDGSIDAMVDLVTTEFYTVTEENEEVVETKLNSKPDYINYSVTYDDGDEILPNHLLAKNGGSETYKVRIEYDEDEVAPSDVTLKCVITATYVQADSNAIPSHSAFTIISGTKGNLQPGDKIGIGETEDFYVISSDNSANGKTVLLAKYNLMVGAIYNDNGEHIGYVQTNNQGYGLQSVDAIGYNGFIYTGAVEFSATNYWLSGNTLISPYNENNTIYYDVNGEWNERYKYVSNNEVAYPYVYDSNYITAPDFSSECEYSPSSTNCFHTPGYSIAYYVEEYRDKLIEFGAPSTITGRLLSYEEADGAQSITDNSQSIIFNGTTYALGNVFDNFNIWDASYSDSFDYTGFFAVRPVIEVYTKDI